MSDNTTYVQGGRGGVGVAGLLGVLFVALKLLGVIAWSWWWVLAPFWIPFAILLVILLVCGIVILLSYAFDR